MQVGLYIRNFCRQKLKESALTLENKQICTLYLYHENLVLTQNLKNKVLQWVRIMNTHNDAPKQRNSEIVHNFNEIHESNKQRIANLSRTDIGAFSLCASSILNILHMNVGVIGSKIFLYYTITEWAYMPLLMS